MRGVALIPLLLALACAGPIATTEDPIDWQAADEHWSLRIVTLDEDGDPRVTRIWLALVDGEGTLRTGDSNWWENLQRDPNCRVRLEGTDYPAYVEFVSEHEQKAVIDDAFVLKYGWLERMMFPEDRGETHDNYARLQPGSAP